MAGFPMSLIDLAQDAIDKLRNTFTDGVNASNGLKEGGSTKSLVTNRILQSDPEEIKQVQLRRTVNNIVVTHFIPNTISTSGWSAGNQLFIAEYNEIILEVLGTSIVGSGSNLQILVECFSIKDKIWYPLPVNANSTQSTFLANPSPNLSVSTGNSVIVAYTLPTNLGDWIRVSLKCATQWTNGQISVVLKCKS